MLLGRCEEMKIALVQPPMGRLIDPAMYPPTGLLYIAAAVDKHKPNHSVEVINFGDSSIDNAVEKLSDFDIVGIAIVSPYRKSAEDLARACARPGRTIVAGGPHATIYPSDMLDTGLFGAVFVGQAERSFISFLDDIDSGREIARRYDGIDGELDDIEMPRIAYGHGDRGVVVLSSRGCVNRCAFCAGHACFNRIQLHSAKRVLEEVDRIAEAGFKEFRFLDDMFAISTIRLKEICEGLKHYGLEWSCHTRVDRVSNETVAMMEDAGCYEMGIGVESFDQRVLDVCNKRTTVMQNVQAINIIYEHGIDVHAYMMIGTPGETESTADTNIQFLEALKGKYKRMQFSTFMPFPGSDTWSTPEAYGIDIVDTNYCDYTQHQYVRDGEQIKEVPLWSPIRIHGLDYEKQMANLLKMRKYIDHLKEYRNKRIPGDV